MNTATLIHTMWEYGTEGGGYVYQVDPPFEYTEGAEKRETSLVGVLSYSGDDQNDTGLEVSAVVFPVSSLEQAPAESDGGIRWANHSAIYQARTASLMPSVVAHTGVLANIGYAIV